MQIAIVLYPGFTALDAIGPYEVLRFLPDSEVRFVSRRVGPVAADSGVLTLQATHTFEETPKPDIVVLPGSDIATVGRASDEALLSWVRKVHQTSRFTLSVCTGALILGAAGLLWNCPATTHWYAMDALAEFGALPQKGHRIVPCGSIITAAGVSAGIDLGLHVVMELAGREEAERIQLILEYDPEPPVSSGHPDKASPAVLDQALKRLIDPRYTKQF
jgi:transcriptional regulator GlxA family with amidase domain